MRHPEGEPLDGSLAGVEHGCEGRYRGRLRAGRRPNKKKTNACQYDEMGAAAYKEALKHYMHVFGCVDKA